MRNNEDINLTKDGKFYNVKKATLLLVSEFFSSYGLKRRAYYKSATGIFFETFQYVKKEHSIESYQDLTIEQNIHKETIVEEKSFKTIQSLFEISEKGNTIPIDFGVNCHCIYRGGQPLSLLKVVNKPIEFNQVVEV
jgi:hypothetical protein|eukprot:TRINITY_DN3717_c0_g1_i1.p1 TRINITY_DN3717_c0_g1~~TRINITY_DN3717_c0_g1_i1.p1  ORF type:complete len:137 (+),score=1.22 TRINITY_DN3717_c0_g1_i1:159-569(+)